MIQIDDKIISTDIFEKRFVCNLDKCKGECCVEGESGAPLEDDEIEKIEEIYPVVKSFLTEKAIQEIEKQGKWIVDSDGDKVTPIINGRECVYTYFDEKGICKCAIDKAYQEGLIDFKKPISCHLYPIRVTKYPDFEGLNYHTWPICHPARELGSQLGVPVYKFLKEPIIRKYGEAFYNEMEDVEKTLKQQGILKG
ncbi:DUF3109 family protein [Carboxylicivirga sp. A043]|uniref:DUF3109 family protein n=1 Tax=Carboxylicivirga litoralis TaxID=2816963 RepID=UPI0021CB4F32|nr:DUF3109 family protein [Carboxylicivirga sp. A043]MCU4154642.1 DUF3109 family protein [Carboxylicivirga sp. A043]